LHYPPQARVLSNYRNVDTKASLKIPAMTVAALREGPALLFGRSRESRNREAAGRRNWPEAVPKKMRGRKRQLVGLTERSVNFADTK
jgi:hypothetical protein